MVHRRFIVSDPLSSVHENAPIVDLRDHVTNDRWSAPFQPINAGYASEASAILGVGFSPSKVRTSIWKILGPAFYTALRAGITRQK